MRRFLFYLIILVLPILTGCGTNVVTGLFFGTGWGGGPALGTNVFFFPQADRSTLTQQDIQLINNAKNMAIQNGYTVTDMSTPDTVGFKASKHIDNIANNDITGLPDFIKKDGPKFITIRNDSSKDYYKIRAVVDLTDMNNPAIINPTASSQSKIRVKMDLPAQTTFTNARRKLNNGKSLEWDLIPGQKNLIEANFEVIR